MGTDEHVCPACRQPVTTVVRRHKTLGAFVPVWGPGPCHNPECEAYVGEPRSGFGASRPVPRTGSAPAGKPREVREQPGQQPEEQPGKSATEK
ncbi:hypothetical protein [Streptomyces sp. NBC_01483]|uniref:hypothetical protein n=1 Tax=Streptomyces sp. NBC_01483 TaxID=2903883 RepID=UPI002E2F0846|nr:hypothetical protein [Streptomyces sp. NBC_01483]